MRDGNEDTTPTRVLSVRLSVDGWVEKQKATTDGDSSIDMIDRSRWLGSETSFIRIHPLRTDTHSN